MQFLWDKNVILFVVESYYFDSITFCRNFNEYYNDATTIMFRIKCVLKNQKFLKLASKKLIYQHYFLEYHVNLNILLEMCHDISYLVKLAQK